MKKVFFIAAGLYAAQLTAQIPLNMEWTQPLGNNQQVIVEPRAIVLDGASNSYSTGLVEPFASSYVYVTKTSASGNVLWSRQFGNSEMYENSGYSIALDPTGNIVIVGQYKNSVDFDPAVFGTAFLSSSVNGGVFVLKLDANGNFIWVKGLVAGAMPFGWEDVTIDPAGNITLSGAFEGSADFDPGSGTFMMSSLGQQAGFVVKLNADGQFTWARKLDAVQITGGSVMPRAIGSDADGNVVVGGYFNGTVDFDPGLSNATATADWTDAFMVKLNSSGQMIWKKTFGGTGYDALMDLTVEGKGRIFVTGNFQNTVVFDPFAPRDAALTAYGNTSAFVGKYSPEGNLNWVDQLGGAAGVVYPYSIAIDAFHRVYTTGWFAGTVDFQPLDVPGNSSGVVTNNVLSDVYELTANGENTYVSMLDKDGAFLSAGLFAGLTNAANDIVSNRGRGIAATDCEIFTTGYYYPGADFDMGSLTYDLYTSLQAGYINKTSTCSMTEKRTEATEETDLVRLQEFTVYPNPVSSQLTVLREDNVVSEKFELVAANGVMVKSGMLEGREFVLDISDLKPGMYILKIAGASRQVVKM